MQCSGVIIRMSDRNLRLLWRVVQCAGLSNGRASASSTALLLRSGGGLLAHGISSGVDPPLRPRTI